ncbi:DNA primase [Candidatus Peregrinibacteria bacterium]|nr:DNA primase [Candidatus Peregrinibacteria bacterium]
MDPISEIKSRISIEELVAQYIPLKKAGRHFKALCPFHQERTPSFYVSPERQLAYCFGCHKGGDHFKFIEEIEGLDFRGALKFLAEKAGVTLPKTLPDEQKRKSERDRLIEIHEQAAKFFEEQLWDTPDGEKVAKYLKKRGLKEKTIKNAQLGFAPESGDKLYTFLLERGFTRGEILTAGLAIARDTEQGNCIDRFRMRLMFPIRNLAGAICAFGGRAVRDGDEPKYLNSPETPIYHKSSVLYGLSEARAEIRQKKSVVIVEGYMDALAAHQAGFQNVVACSGTALTTDQLAILKRFTQNLFLAFDRDTAGKLATNRSIELAFAAEFSLRVVVWKSDAKDPDECLRKDPDEFAKAIEEAKPATEYLLESCAENFDSGAAEGKRKIIEELLPFFAQIKSAVELDVWLKQCASNLGISLSALYDELKRFQGKQKFLGQPVSKITIKPELSFSTETGSFIRHQEYILGLLLTYPELTSVAFQLLKPEDFDDIELQNIYRSLSTEYNQNLGERANLLAMYAETFAADMTFDAVQEELKSIINALKHLKLDREKRSLVERLQNAPAKEKQSLLEEYQALLLNENNIL